MILSRTLLAVAIAAASFGCTPSASTDTATYEINPRPQYKAAAVAKMQLPPDSKAAPLDKTAFIQQPLVANMFTADPSAHVFDGKIWIYPSHDIETTEKLGSGEGSAFDMRDYHVFSMDSPSGPIKDWGPALKIEDVPWARSQLWAPDAAYKDGRYYLFFPAKDDQGIFRIGVASSDVPQGPFIAEPDFIAGTYSIDPAVYQDGENYYLYVGGIRGGQLQKWHNNAYHGEDRYTGASGAAHLPKVAKLSDSLTELAEPLRDLLIVDHTGHPLSNEHPYSFFEAPWVHKHQGTYYLTYSTGETRSIAYATGTSPTGPFTYRGVMLEPVYGWTNHHSTVFVDNQWYLFYHDSQMSGGKTHLRNIKMMPFNHNPDGTISPLSSLTSSTQ